MIEFAVELAKLACLGAFAFVWFVGWATCMEWFSR